MPDRDLERIAVTFTNAVDQGADGILIGFVLSRHPTRVVWTDFERIGAGIVHAGEPPPDVPPGTRASDWRLAGLAFLEHPDAEPSRLRPSRFAERPWFLTDYPGAASWTRLRRAAELELSPGSARELQPSIKHRLQFPSWWWGRRWARLLARSPSDEVDVFDRGGNWICSGLLTRRPDGRAALVPDHHYVLAHYAMRDGELKTRYFVPWPSLHLDAVNDAEGPDP